MGYLWVVIGSDSPRDKHMGTGKISATAVRFIKLGVAGRFEKSALEDSSLYLGYHKVPDARFERDTGYKQMFFVCHTAKGKLLTDHPDIFVWSGAKVADMAVKTGLADWVLEKVQ